MQCAMCSQDLKFPEEILKCHVCSQQSHPTCVGIREEKFRKMQPAQKQSWKCGKCRSNPPDLKPKAPSLQPDLSVPQDQNEASKEFLTSLIEDIISEKFDDLKRYIKNEISDLKQTIEFNSGSIKELSDKNTKLEKEISALNKSLKSTLIENQQLKSQIEDLTHEVIDLQQYSRRTNIEIAEIPESSENTEEIVKKVIKALDLNEEVKISAAHRIPTKNVNKQKPIIVQFQTKYERDMVIKAAKSKKLSAQDVEINFPNTPIYINEHLCPALKKIYFEARQFKKKHNYRFCWVRDAKIFLRQEDNSKAIRIRKMSDFPDVPHVWSYYSYPSPHPIQPKIIYRHHITPYQPQATYMRPVHIRPYAPVPYGPASVSYGPAPVPYGPVQVPYAPPIMPMAASPISYYIPKPPPPRHPMMHHPFTPAASHMSGYFSPPVAPPKYPIKEFFSNSMQAFSNYPSKPSIFTKIKPFLFGSNGPRSLPHHPHYPDFFPPHQFVPNRPLQNRPSAHMAFPSYHPAPVSQGSSMMSPENSCSCSLHVGQLTVYKHTDVRSSYSCTDLTDCNSFCTNLFSSEDLRAQTRADACLILGKDATVPWFRRDHACDPHGVKNDTKLSVDLCCKDLQPC